TRSPVLKPLRPGSITRPSDSWPRTRRVAPGGAHPYLPSAISTSVPQTPTATASTRTDPSRASGSAMSSSRTDPGFPGSTVTAFIGAPRLLLVPVEAPATTFAPGHLELALPREHGHPALGPDQTSRDLAGRPHPRLIAHHPHLVDPHARLDGVVE